jgi:hypothetical protein
MAKEKISKMEAVRRALNAGVTERKEIPPYIKKHFGLEINLQMAGMYKSNIKKKAEAANGTQVPKAAVKAAGKAKHEPWSADSDLTEAAAAARNYGGIDKLIASLEELKKLQVG